MAWTGGKSTLPRVVDNSQITSEAAGWQCGRSKGGSVWEVGRGEEEQEGGASIARLPADKGACIR